MNPNAQPYAQHTGTEPTDALFIEQRAVGKENFASAPLAVCGGVAERCPPPVVAGIHVAPMTAQQLARV